MDHTARMREFFRVDGDGLHGARQPAPTDVIRLLDVLLALFILVALLPAMLLIVVAIKVQDGGPVFFRQTRIGYGGQLFACWKFRTMVVDAESRLEALLKDDSLARREWNTFQKLRHDPRITWIGSFLRKSSLDEFPQLFNVLRGEMSLVGPRPITLGEVERYGHWFTSYCSVRPGVSGLWQTCGRNNVSFQKRVAFDVVFVRRRSLRLYLRILLATVPAVLTRNGSY